LVKVHSRREHAGLQAAEWAPAPKDRGDYYNEHNEPGHAALEGAGPPWMFAKLADRVSGSIINANLPFYYQGDDYDGPNSATAMWVLRPEAVEEGVNCAYDIDAASVQFQCHPWDNGKRAGDLCTPGCHWATSKNLDNRWCGSKNPMHWNWEWGIGREEDYKGKQMMKWDEHTFNAEGQPDFFEGFTVLQNNPEKIFPRFDDEESGLCPWHPAKLKSMLEAHERRIHRCGIGKGLWAKPCCTCCSYPRCVLYNEIVINAKAWDASMPGGLEAVAVPAHAGPRAWKSARTMHLHLMGRCTGLATGASPTRYDYPRADLEGWIPLLKLNASEAERPFQQPDEAVLDQLYGPPTC
jgi:hypothetical protein